MSSSLILKRSSRLYKFVFGREAGKIEGFPEPSGRYISFGLFIGLFVAMTLVRILGFCMFLLMDAILKIIFFMADGSYVRGSVLTNLQVIEINPWPRIRNRRLPPWGLFATAVVLYQYWNSGVVDAAGSLLLFLFVTAVLLTIQPGPKSIAETVTTAIEPKMDGALRRAYNREPTLFPKLYIVD